MSDRIKKTGKQNVLKTRQEAFKLAHRAAFLAALVICAENEISAQPTVFVGGYASSIFVVRGIPGKNGDGPTEWTFAAQGWKIEGMKNPYKCVLLSEEGADKLHNLGFPTATAVMNRIITVLENRLVELGKVVPTS